MPPAAVRLGGAVEPDLLGGKGAALDRLVRWGLPVPPSGAVTTQVYRRFVEHDRIASLIASIRAGGAVGADEVDDVFAEGRLAPGDLASVRAVAREVGGGKPIAVRSSATVEDLARSSFAGQYRSLLDVDAADADAVGAAVKSVFASLWHPAPVAYRKTLGIDDASAAMAVVLMRMVPARRAGVVFTVDPGGDTSLARVEAVEGLADSLVSGAETPVAVSLPREGDRGGTAGEMVEALDLALRVERLAGRPQDVEWAWDGCDVWLVQARPITVAAAQDGDGFDDDEGTLVGVDLTTAGFGETLPGVLPPLLWVIGSHLVEEAFRQLLDHLAALPEDVTGTRVVVRRVRGRAAMDFGRLQASMGALPGPASDDLETEYFGSRRPGRPAAPIQPRAGSRVRSAVHDMRVLRVGSRAAKEASTLGHAARLVVDDRPELRGFSAESLLAYHLRLVDLGTRAMAAELGVSADATGSYRRLQVRLGRRLGEVEAGRLTDRLVGRAGVAAETSECASAAVFAGPTWLELGHRPLALPARSETAREEAFEEAFDEVLHALRSQPGRRHDSLTARLRTWSLRHLVAEVTDKLARRERMKATVLLVGGEVRRVHLEAGRRLVGLGHLDDPADIDLLTPGEVAGLLRGHRPLTPDVIGHRRRWRDRYEHDGPLPHRFTGRPDPVVPAPLAGRRVDGWAASGGRFRGVVQVVTSPTDRLERDAVMVAEATDPSWAPLFLRAGAIVLDRGGPLSHGAILARELGVPAVLNVPGATRLLAGHEVTVDGDAGVVTVHDLDDDGRRGADPGSGDLP
ncbi:MAG TPA: PEP/pyruvate-binding domain-containing protein [Ornithinibacter sp.]|nr:PEP/pyruvate-binding domain-containing protein [Ornithinibacter sp.]